MHRGLRVIIGFSWCDFVNILLQFTVVEIFLSGLLQELDDVTILFSLLLELPSDDTVTHTFFITGELVLVTGEPLFLEDPFKNDFIFVWLLISEVLDKVDSKDFFISALDRATFGNNGTKWSGLKGPSPDFNVFSEQNKMWEARLEIPERGITKRWNSFLYFIIGLKSG